MDIDHFFLEDSEDHLILLHREIHFDGDFSRMLEYYEKGGKGVHPEIEIDRIRQLATYEQSSEQNLAPVLLTENEVEAVLMGRQLYQTLREQVEEEGSSIPQKIAALILTESRSAHEEMEALLEEGDEVVPYLMELLNSEHFRRAEFPGYGLGPELAASMLGKVGGDKVVIPLFEQISRGGFDLEEAAMRALHDVGEPAKQFLLKLVQAEPRTEDNERALMALIKMKEDEEVQRVCSSLEADSDAEPVFAEFLEMIRQPS